MSKLYRRNTGLIIASGKALNVRNNPVGKEVEIEIEEFDKQTKERKKRLITAVSNSVDDDVATGKIVTAIGYQSGMDIITAHSITAGASLKYIEDVEVISGPVHKVEYKAEVNENGTPKLKRDGQPRKPHFDVTIRVPDEQGHNVSHRVKIYNFAKPRAEGDRTEIEKAQKIFERFVDREETPVFATIVTKPGTTSSWESEYNGRVYQNFASDHLGRLSWDFNWMVDDRPLQRNQTEPESVSSQIAPQSNQIAQGSTGSQYQQSAQPKTYGTSSIQIEDGSYL